MLVQRTTLNPTEKKKRKTLSAETYRLNGKQMNKKKKLQERDKYLRLRRPFPSPPGRFSPTLAALDLSSSLCLQPFSQAQRWRGCYRKRCGPRSAATSSAARTHTHRGVLRSGTRIRLRHLRLKRNCAKTISTALK